jgi:hypothetical protein
VRCSLLSSMAFTSKPLHRDVVMAPVDFRPDQQLRAAMASSVGMASPMRASLRPRHPPTQLHQRETAAATERAAQVTRRRPASAHPSTKHQDHPRDGFSMSLVYKPDTSPATTSRPWTASTRRRPSAETWKSPCNEQRARSELDLVVTDQAPMQPQYDGRRRWQPRARVTTLDFVSGQPIRRTEQPSQAAREQLVQRATQYRRIPASEKEELVAVRASREYDRLAGSLSIQAHTDMLMTMAARPRTTQTGATRRPTPAQATARGRIVGSTGAALKHSRSNPFQWGITEAGEMQRTGRQGVADLGRTQARYGAAGWTGLSIRGMTIGSKRGAANTAGGARSHMPETHDRAQPRCTHRGSGLGKLPLRAVFAEPTASVGLISPVRRTKFTAQ